VDIIKRDIKSIRSLILQQASVVHNQGNNRVYKWEEIKDIPAGTPNYDTKDIYEYSQPKSFRMRGTNNFQVSNPFDTPAQYALLYAQVSDAGAYLALTTDNNDMTGLPVTTNSIQDFPGWIISQQNPITPIAYWVDFSDFVLVRCTAPSSFTTFTLGFRRRKNMYIPQNTTMFNEPSQ
jgi:hypothetical protein